MRLAREADATTVHDLRASAAAWQVTHGIAQWSPGEIGLSAVHNQDPRDQWWVSPTINGHIRGAVGCCLRT